MGKHVQLLWLVVACCLAAAVAASAQAHEPLLPEQLEKAQRLGAMRVTAPGLERLTGEPVAAILREYGAVGAEQAEYLRGANRFRVTLHVMHDRSGAYGAFTFLRGPNPGLGLGEGGALGPDSAIFYQGTYLVVADNQASPSVLRALARALAERDPEQSSLPLLPDYLPEQGLIPRSDMYILGPITLGRVAPLEQGDWAGFAYGAEVEAARYRIGSPKSGSSEATLLLLSYPTPQIARARLADFHRLLNLNGQGGGSGPPVFAKRKSTLVVLVQGAQSAEEADKLIDSVRFQQEISWSEPTPVDDKEVISGLIGIFLGTGSIVIVTLGLGLAFGAARLLLLSTLPGRVFDKSVENERIFLNLQNPK